jgi:hypothetical protein
MNNKIPLTPRVYTDLDAETAWALWNSLEMLQTNIWTFFEDAFLDFCICENEPTYTTEDLEKHLDEEPPY